VFNRINWEITYRCNLNCDFCFIRESKKLNSPAIRELNPAQAKSFVDSVADLKPSFYLTGGEPFARADSLDIIAHIRDRGCGCGINTNGTLLNRDKIRRLCALRPDYVIVSLHGPSSVHDRLCGKPGTFSRAAKSLALLAAHAQPGTEIIASCTISEKNCGRLYELFRLCR
jgi:MoaA/NifB/PqqE/SkfB family radical SAM enzyme